MRKNAIILFSGGIDSTACLYYYLKEGFKPSPLFIDYGQRASRKEYESAKKITNFYNIKLDHVKVEMSTEFGIGEIKGRNALFIVIALMNNPNFIGLISLGIHSSISYYDSTQEFINDIKVLLDKYTDGKVNLDAPFIMWDKVMIYEYCKNNNIPIELTYSCELGTELPCGQCRSCLDRKVLNAS